VKKHFYELFTTNSICIPKKSANISPFSRLLNYYSLANTPKTTLFC